MEASIVFKSKTCKLDTWYKYQFWWVGVGWHFIYICSNTH